MISQQTVKGCRSTKFGDPREKERYDSHPRTRLNLSFHSKMSLPTTRRENYQMYPEFTKEQWNLKPYDIPLNPGWFSYISLYCRKLQSLYGCFPKWWYPQNTPKSSFLVGKPMVVGQHHFRKPPYSWVESSIYSPTNQGGSLITAKTVQAQTL